MPPLTNAEKQKRHRERRQRREADQAAEIETQSREIDLLRAALDRSEAQRVDLLQTIAEMVKSR